MAFIRVLVAEDDRAIRDLLVHHLKRDGFTPLEAADGPTTLRMSREGVDLILLDVGLPGVDGFDIARSLRRGGTHHANRYDHRARRRSRPSRRIRIGR